PHRGHAAASAPHGCRLAPGGGRRPCGDRVPLVAPRPGAARDAGRSRRILAAAVSPPAGPRPHVRCARPPWWSGPPVARNASGAAAAVPSVELAAAGAAQLPPLRWCLLLVAQQRASAVAAHVLS